MDLNLQITNLINKYPNLKYDSVQNKLSGSIEVYSEDSYEIDIFLKDFPATVPTVYEIGERIPHKSDRHVYKNGALCFATPLTISYLMKNKISTITDFVEKLIIPYLKNNSYYELKGKYMFGEHSHDIKLATLESLQDLLGITNIKLILDLICNVLDNEKFTPNKLCYCGSNIKIKKCSNHFERYKKLKSLGKENLFKSFVLLYSR